MLRGDLRDQGTRIGLEKDLGRGQWGVSLTLIQFALIGHSVGCLAISPVFPGTPAFKWAVLILDLLQILPTKSKRARRQKLEEKRGHTVPEVTTHPHPSPLCCQVPSWGCRRA